MVRWSRTVKLEKSPPSASIATKSELYLPDAVGGGVPLPKSPGNQGQLHSEEHVLPVPPGQGIPAAEHERCSWRGRSCDAIQGSAATCSGTLKSCASRPPTGNIVACNQRKNVDLGPQRLNMGRIVRRPKDGPGSDQTSCTELPASEGVNKVKLDENADISFIDPEGDTKIDRVVGAAQDRA